MNAGRHVGGYLVQLRQRRRLSQRQLAHAAGVSPATVVLVERGARVPSRGVVLRLATALALPPVQTDGLLLAAGYAPTPPTVQYLADLLRAG